MGIEDIRNNGNIDTLQEDVGNNSKLNKGYGLAHRFKVWYEQKSSVFHHG